MLVAERISKNFGNVVCLRQISFAVAPGEFVAVIGTNGSGKTTLLDILSGFVHADSGTISILGMRAESRSSQWRARRGLLRTFQEPLVNEQLSVSECLKLAAWGAKPPGIIASLHRGQSYRGKDTVALSDLLGPDSVTDLFTREKRLISSFRHLRGDGGIPTTKH